MTRGHREPALPGLASAYADHFSQSMRQVAVIAINVRDAEGPHIIGPRLAKRKALQVMDRAIAKVEDKPRTIFKPCDIRLHIAEMPTCQLGVVGHSVEPKI